MSYTTRKITLRLVGTCWLLVLFVSPAGAEMTAIEDADGQQGLTVYRMTITPAAEPVPAFKYRLCLRPHELKPGNAAIHYIRLHAENTLGGAWRGARQEFGDAIDDWYDIDDVTLEQLPLEKVRRASAIFDTVVEQYIQLGTRCRESDWGLEIQDLRGIESIEFLLPDFQHTRSLARILALRTRLRIAERRYDDAIEHLRMSYRLARDVGQEKLLVCNLIGMAIEGITNGILIDFIAAADSPNMYWALADLPEPLVNMRDAMRLEMSLGLRVFPVLLEVESAEYSEEKWSRLMAEGMVLFEYLKDFDGSSRSLGDLTESEKLRTRLASTGLSLAAYPAAKERLRLAGMSAQRLEKMPVGQVLLIDVAREYQQVSDTMEKWWCLPYPLARDQLKNIEQAPFPVNGELNYGRMLANALLPAVKAAKIAHARMQWRKNALMVVEALRMHAAQTGQLPERLADIQIVPVPKNTLTEQPYQYRLDGKTAVLELPFSDGIPNAAWRFEIQLAEEK